MDLKKQPNRMVPVRDVQGDKKDMKRPGQEVESKEKGQLTVTTK